MKQKVENSQVEGTIRAPASKSFAQRAVAIASLADGISEIEFLGDSDDVLAAIDVCKALGAEIHGDSKRLTVRGNIKLPIKPLDCGESGLSIRMFSAVAATLRGEITLTGRGSLNKRPMNMIEQSLRSAGAGCKSNKGYLPITVEGPLPGGIVQIDGSVSSQVLTGLLIASPHAIKPYKFKVDDLKSKPYIDITTSIMKSFGVDLENNKYEEFYIPAPQTYKSRHYIVEGDWSGAAFLLVAGAIAGEITLENLNIESSQADKAVMNALEECGAIVSINNDLITVIKNELNAFKFDATHCPDLFPPLVALAAACRGTSEINGVSRLRVKESDRAMSLKQEYNKLGIEISIEGDRMIINGGTPRGGKIYSHQDHRIAMACAITGLISKEPVIIEASEAVNKSYPGFFKDLKKVSVKTA